MGAALPVFLIADFLLSRSSRFGCVGADSVSTFVSTFEEKSVSDRERKLLKVICFLLKKMRYCKEKKKEA